MHPSADNDPEETPWTEHVRHGLKGRWIVRQISFSLVFCECSECGARAVRYAKSKDYLEVAGLDGGDDG